MSRFRLPTLLGAMVAVSLAPAARGQASDQGRLPFSRPTGAYEVDVEPSTMIPMRDGVRLATDVYRPKGVADALPTILIRLPYNKSAYRGATGPANYFASHGYAVVVQDVRGKFASEGDYHVYQGDTTDWPDTFNWIATQPWSTGNVGTFGCSYLGEGQIIAAQQRNPHHIAAIAHGISRRDTGCASRYRARASRASTATSTPAVTTTTRRPGGLRRTASITPTRTCLSSSFQLSPDRYQC